MTPASVRDATPADAEAIARVARASWSETYREIFETDFIAGFLERNYEPGALAQQAERAATSGDEHFLVAERGGEIVGYLHFGTGRHGPEQFRVYADPAHFGSGVGSALLAELHRRLDGRVDAYLLDVHSRNERGRAFYDRTGFVIVGGGDTVDCDLTLLRTLRPVRASLPIRTERLSLRSLTDADAPALHRIYGDAETMRHVGRSRRPTADLDATRHVVEFVRRHEELHGFSMWAIDEAGGDPVVGIAGLIWVEGHGPDVEAAYILRRDRWGRGYATESLRAVLEVGHGELGLERIVALAYPENDASRRVMEKAEMRPEGTIAAYGHELTRHVSVRGGRPA